MKVKAPRPPKPPLVLVPFADLRKPDLSDRVLVRDLIDQATIVLVMGQPKCGKTYFTLDMGLHIALGQAWFGRRIRRGRVVYVAAEAGDTVRNRISAFALRYENLIAAASVDFAAITSPVDLCHLGEDDDDVKRLVKAIGKADVVVIDTVSRALAGGDENSPEDMGSFVKACDALRDQLKCTVIAVHHEGKDAARGGRGHSLLSCAVDTIIKVEKTNGVSVATTVAQRDGPGGGQIAFKLVPVELGRRDEHDHEPVMSCVVEEAEQPEPSNKPLRGQKKDLLDALDAAVAAEGVNIGEEAKAVTHEQWRSQAQNSGRFEARSFRTTWSRVRKNLIDDGLVGERNNGSSAYHWRVGRFGRTRPSQADGLGSTHDAQGKGVTSATCNAPLRS